MSTSDLTLTITSISFKLNSGLFIPIDRGILLFDDYDQVSTVVVDTDNILSLVQYPLILDLVDDAFGVYVSSHGN